MWLPGIDQIQLPSTSGSPPFYPGNSRSAFDKHLFLLPVPSLWQSTVLQFLFAENPCVLPECRCSLRMFRVKALAIISNTPRSSQQDHCHAWRESKIHPLCACGGPLSHPTHLQHESSKLHQRQQTVFLIRSLGSSALSECSVVIFACSCHRWFRYAPPRAIGATQPATGYWSLIIVFSTPVRKMVISPPSQARAGDGAPPSLPCAHLSQSHSMVSANAPARCTSSTMATRSR